MRLTRPAYILFPHLLQSTCLRWLPALFLGCVLNTAAEDVEVRLRLVPQAEDAWKPAPPLDTYNLLALRDAAADSAEETLWQRRILGLLQEHHKPTSADPVFLAADMNQMALYFSRYPEVRALFEDLAEERWQWQYSQGSAETQVVGSRLQVNSALVLFDPRAGARFHFQRACEQRVPHCYTAPVDVFLHELLHAHTILRDSRTFIDQGGLNPHFYPFVHEQHTITLERRLYASMAAQDRIPRPKRRDHTGRRTDVSCATCLR